MNDLISGGVEGWRDKPVLIVLFDFPVAFANVCVVKTVAFPLQVETLLFAWSREGWPDGNKNKYQRGRGTISGQLYLPAHNARNELRLPAL